MTELSNGEKMMRSEKLKQMAGSLGDMEAAHTGVTRLIRSGLPEDCKTQLQAAASALERTMELFRAEIKAQL